MACRRAPGASCRVARRAVDRRRDRGSIPRAVGSPSATRWPCGARRVDATPSRRTAASSRSTVGRPLPRPNTWGFLPEIWRRRRSRRRVGALAQEGRNLRIMTSRAATNGRRPSARAQRAVAEVLAEATIAAPESAGRWCRSANDGVPRSWLISWGSPVRRAGHVNRTAGGDPGATVTRGICAGQRTGERRCNRGCHRAHDFARARPARATGSPFADVSSPRETGCTAVIRAQGSPRRVGVRPPTNGHRVVFSDLPYFLH